LLPGIAELIDNLQGDSQMLLKRWPYLPLRGAGDIAAVSRHKFNNLVRISGILGRCIDPRWHESKESTNLELHGQKGIAMMSECQASRNDNTNRMTTD
jgi:hypothetical protein